ncbi:MAG TPA: DUF1064 domain-containing protein [Terricaulis sp.]|nr:DUF1064 domain-containing protein [Terricaulis sp.]
MSESVAAALGLDLAKRKNKYGARRVTNRADGERFDGRGEAKRYDALRLAERAGEIRGLRRQVRFQLWVEMGGRRVHIADYVADFAYRKAGENRDTIEDFKGYRTREYVMKRKLMWACHGIEIHETGKENGRQRGKRGRPKAKSQSHQGGQHG